MDGCRAGTGSAPIDSGSNCSALSVSGMLIVSNPACPLFAGAGSQPIVAARSATRLGGNTTAATSGACSSRATAASGCSGWTAGSTVITAGNIRGTNGNGSGGRRIWAGCGS